MRRIGKRGRINLAANKKLKEEFAGTRYCEIQLDRCLGNWPLQRCHRHKRNWYYDKPPEMLSDRKQVVIGCQNCHDDIEHDAKLTEKVFLKLRGPENQNAN